MADENLNHDPKSADPANSGESPQDKRGSKPAEDKGSSNVNPERPAGSSKQPASGETNPTVPLPSSAPTSDDDFLTTRFASDSAPVGAPNGSSTGESSSKSDEHGEPAGGKSSGSQAHAPRPAPQTTPAPGYGANPVRPTGEGPSQGGPNWGSGQNGTSYGSNGSGYGQNASYGQNPGGGSQSYGPYGYASGYGQNYGAGTNPPYNGSGWSGTGWNNGGYPNSYPGKNAAARSKKRKAQGTGVWGAAIISAVIAAVLVLAIGWGGIASGLITVPSSTSLNSLNATGSGSGSAKVPTGKTVDWQALNRRVAASVVSIQAQVSNGVAAGSGAILDTSGNIVTNNHVVEGSSQLQVTLNNGNIYAATIVGQDSTTDLAVIRLKNPPKNLTPVTFADSNALAVGEQIMSIGNPLGYENTATTGIISALNRPVSVSDESTNSEIVTNAVQIDAAINPGNSGGPTFDAAGQVIGINSSIATASSSSSSSSSSSGSIGIGFAIPSNLVKRVATAIIKQGHVDHAQLGITIRNGSAQADGATRAGAEVVSVNAGGPGSQAGLQKNDVIVGFNGNTVSGMYSLLGYVRAASVGETVRLTVIRGGKAVNLGCKLTQVETRSTGKSRSNNRSQNPGNGNGNQGNGNGNNGSNGNGNNGNGNGSNGNNNGSPFDFGGLSDPFGWF